MSKACAPCVEFSLCARLLKNSAKKINFGHRSILSVGGSSAKFTFQIGFEKDHRFLNTHFLRGGRRLDRKLNGRKDVNWNVKPSIRS